MTPERMTEIRTALNWSAKYIADETRTGLRQVQRWSAGEAVIPKMVADWLEECALWWPTRPPAPILTGWQNRTGQRGRGSAHYEPGAVAAAKPAAPRPGTQSAPAAPSPNARPALPKPVPKPPAIKRTRRK